MGRNSPILNDVLLVIDVVKEKIKRGDALYQTRFQLFPFIRRDDARHEIERENTLRTLGVTVDVLKVTPWRRKARSTARRLASNSSGPTLPKCLRKCR